MAINPIALYAKPFDVVGAETRVLQNRIAREEPAPRIPAPTR